MITNYFFETLTNEKKKTSNYTYLILQKERVRKYRCNFHFKQQPLNMQHCECITKWHSNHRTISNDSFYWRSSIGTECLKHSVWIQDFLNWVFSFENALLKGNSDLKTTRVFFWKWLHFLNINIFMLSSLWKHEQFFVRKCAFS